MNAIEMYNYIVRTAPSKDLKMFSEWKKDRDEEKEEILNSQYEYTYKKFYSQFFNVDDFDNGIDFFQAFYDELTSVIMSSPLKSKNVFYRGLTFKTREKYEEFISQKTMKSDKFDSFTPCLRVAKDYSVGKRGKGRSGFPVILITYFPKGSHLAKVEKRRNYNLYERLTLSGNVYEFVDVEFYEFKKEDEVFPTRLTIVLAKLIEENGEKMGEIKSFKSEKLDTIRRMLTKQNKEGKFFSLKIENLKFDGGKEDFTSIFSTFVEDKPKIKFKSFDELIFDDIENNCLYEIRVGKYVYPNVIFELDENLDLDLEFPFGYSFDYSIEKNRVGRKYYLIKITL